MLGATEGDLDLLRRQGRRGDHRTTHHQLGVGRLAALGSQLSNHVGKLAELLQKVELATSHAIQQITADLRPQCFIARLVTDGEKSVHQRLLIDHLHLVPSVKHGRSTAEVEQLAESTRRHLGYAELHVKGLFGDIRVLHMPSGTSGDQTATLKLADKQHVQQTHTRAHHDAAISLGRHDTVRKLPEAIVGKYGQRQALTRIVEIGAAGTQAVAQAIDTAQVCLAHEAVEDRL